MTIERKVDNKAAALAMVRKSSQPLDNEQIAQRLDVKRGTANDLMKKLEAEDLVERRDSGFGGGFAWVAKKGGAS